MSVVCLFPVQVCQWLFVSGPGWESQSGFLRLWLEVEFPAGSGAPDLSGFLQTHSNLMCWMIPPLWSTVHPSSLGTQLGKSRPGRHSFPSLYVPSTDTAHTRPPNN